ncbi:MAG: branched-chain amino acid ABC transporter permease [Nakamurella sp.]
MSGDDSSDGASVDGAPVDGAPITGSDAISGDPGSGPETLAVSALNIGTDEWVAQHETRTSTGHGVGARVNALWMSGPAAVRWGLPLLVFVLFPVLVSDGYLLRIGVNLGLFALLALGLNVVIGYAGLLDLGFVAFYGCGAYAYALLSSDKLGVHLPTWLSVPAAVLFTALIGLLVSLPSRRLSGDYLAIVTLFFGQIFTELVLAGDAVSLPGASDPVDITGGANGISGVSGWSVFGFSFNTNRSYYYLVLFFVVVLVLGLGRISRSRMGRAWRAIGEDPLAAASMTIRVNRLKLLAFVVGAGIAGLSGTIFSAVQVGVYASSFDLPMLILLYAAVILGGSGSLPGTLIGAAIMSVLPEVLRQPTYSELLFFVGLVAGVLWILKPKIGALVLAATVAVGFAINIVLLAVGVPYLSAAEWTQGVIGELLGRWLFVPQDRLLWGNVAFVLLIIAVAAFSRMHGRAKMWFLPLLLWLSVFVWMVRLSTEASLTRQLVIGATLVVLMIARPQGIFGKQRVEVL